MSAELAALASDPARLEDVPPSELPVLAGEAAALHARILARLVTPLAPVAVPASNGPEPDTLLKVDEAAGRLGVNRRWMYRHADSLPFTKRLTGGTLRFSARGLERWKERR